MPSKINLSASQFVARNSDKVELIAVNARRRMDPYVPFDSGNLKNIVKINGNLIIYTQDYARRQYYENKGNGVRGNYWNKRMIAGDGKAFFREAEKIWNN